MSPARATNDRRTPIHDEPPTVRDPMRWPLRHATKPRAPAVPLYLAKPRRLPPRFPRAIAAGPQSATLVSPPLPAPTPRRTSPNAVTVDAEHTFVRPRPAPEAETAFRPWDALLAVVGLVVAAVVLFGCSEPLAEPSDPIVERNGERASPPPKSTSSAPSSPAPAPPLASSSSSSSPSSAPPSAPTPPPTTTPVSGCAVKGAEVYAFADTTNAFRYALDPSPPPGFTALGVAFRAARSDATEPHAPLYILKNERIGDYLVSTVPTEGSADGFGTLGTLGEVFVVAVPGSVPLARYYKESPLRHRVSIDGDQGDWLPEPPRGWVCPR